MAFAAGSESNEGVQFAKYIGVGSFNVVGINPTKAQLEALYDGATFKDEPVYESKDDAGVSQIRIDIYLKSVAEKNDGIEFITKASFFLKKAPFISKSNKIQVINVYGATTWIDVEVAKTGVVPQNLSWYEGPYRPAYIGEEDLTNFLKTYLGIPNKSYRNQAGEVITIKNPADAEARLDNIDKYFTGNVKELADIIAFQPSNKIKASIGIKTTDDNKQYQVVYTKKFLKNGVTDYSKLDAEIKATQEAGGYKNTEFSAEPLHEYSVVATALSAAAGNTPPSGAPVDMSAFFGGNK